MYSQTGLGGLTHLYQAEGCQQPCDLTAVSGNINISFIILLNSKELRRSKWTQPNLTTSTNTVRHQCSKFLWRAQWQADRPQQHLTQQCISLHQQFLYADFPVVHQRWVRDTFKTLSTQSLGSTESFHWLLQPLTGSVISLWHSLLIYRWRGLVFLGKGTRGACGHGQGLLSPQSKNALLAEAVAASRLVGVVQDQVAVGALVALLQAFHKLVVGVGLEVQRVGAGGVLAREDARESSGFVTGHGSCTGKRSRHREKLFKYSLAATRPRLPLAVGCCWQEGSHLQGGDRFQRETWCQLWKNNKTLTEPQNEDYTTSIKAHFFGRELHNLKIIPQNWDFYGLVGFCFFLIFLQQFLVSKKLQADTAGESRGQVLALMLTRKVST